MHLGEYKNIFESTSRQRRVPIKFCHKRCLITKIIHKKVLFKAKDNQEDKREDLELIWRFLSNSGKENSKVSKNFKKRIRNNFKIVSMGADSNVMCIFSHW